MSDFSRRKFLKTGAAALAGITIAPSSILGMSHGHVVDVGMSHTADTYGCEVQFVGWGNVSVAHT